MKHPAPNPSGIAAEHWKAAAQGRLALPRCTGCGRFQWPPRARCLACRAPLAWHEASGRGTIATYSIVRRAVNEALAADVPYAVALVALDEGVRLFTNVVGVAPDALRTGMRVRCRFEPTLDPALSVPVFEPDDEPARDAVPSGGGPRA